MFHQRIQTPRHLSEKPRLYLVWLSTNVPVSQISLQTLVWWSSSDFETPRNAQLLFSTSLSVLKLEEDLLSYKRISTYKLCISLSLNEKGVVNVTRMCSTFIDRDVPAYWQIKLANGHDSQRLTL